MSAVSLRSHLSPAFEAEILSLVFMLRNFKHSPLRKSIARSSAGTFPFCATLMLKGIPSSNSWIFDCRIVSIKGVGTTTEDCSNSL